VSGKENVHCRTVIPALVSDPMFWWRRPARCCRGASGVCPTPVAEDVDWCVRCINDAEVLALSTEILLRRSRFNARRPTYCKYGEDDTTRSRPSRGETASDGCAANC
jgi:hypothetical protein